MKLLANFKALIRAFWPSHSEYDTLLSNNPVIIKRRKDALLASICMTFIPNFLFLLYDLIAWPLTHIYNLLTILISCLPAVYYYYRKRMDYAQFFAYFPPTLTMAGVSVFDLSAGARYGNLEFTLVLYAAACIIYFNYRTGFIFLSINVLTFLAIKVYRYSLYTVGSYEPYELAEDLVVSLACYGILTVVSYYYKYDFIEIDKKNGLLQEQKQIIEEQALQLTKTNSAKDKLFSVIAHDLRSPILSLKVILEMLNSKQISHDEFRQLSNRIENSVNSLYGMLDNLLLWSLSQMNGINPKPTLFLLYHTITENILLFDEIAQSKSIVINNNFPKNLGVYGDEYQIKTVVRNIINNALKFTPSNGRIFIGGIEEKNFIILTIADTGVGIKSKNLKSIFSGIHVTSSVEGQKSTGIGLVLCKELIEKNNGQISIQSKENIGTTVNIKLPNSLFALNKRVPK